MSDDSVVQINDGLWIPRAELDFRASRSGGPGGQHVNTSSTRIELLWDVGATPSLDEAQRARVREKLANRINAEGVLLIAASEHRSQSQNREAAVARFAELLAAALVVPKRRRKTRMPRAAKEARLQAKKQRSQTKKMRGPVRRDE
jgi:ribosome-associated protein